MEQLAAGQDSLQLMQEEARGGRSSFEELSSRDEIAEVVDALARHRCRGIARNSEFQIAIQMVAVGQDVGAIRWKMIDGDYGLAAPFWVEIEGHNSIYRFLIKKSFQHLGFAVTGMPETVEVFRHRWQRRVSAVGRVQVRNSVGRMSGRIRDVSYGGLSFWLSSADIQNEASLLEVEVELEGGVASLECVICFIQQGFGERVLCGAKILKFHEESVVWHRFVENHLYPNTRVGARWCNAMWKLYEKCGYFNLSGKAPSMFSSTRFSAFSSVSRLLDHAPHVGCQVVWPAIGDGSVAAALSMLKVYSGTWLGYQGAKVSGPTPDGVPGRTVLFGIHQRAYEHVQKDPDLKWYLAYLQVKKIWTRMAHVELNIKYVPDGDAYIVRFQAYEASSIGQRMGAKPVTAQVDVASSSELDVLAAAIRQHRPDAYLDGLDLVRERLDMRVAKRLWSGVRLERERIILVARRFGNAVAAAILELGAEGAHIYGLLDVVRLFPLEPGGEAAYIQLFEASQSWYREQGREKFICFVEDGLPIPDALSCDLVDLGAADLVLLSAQRMPDWLEQVHRVTAPRAVPVDVDASWNGGHDCDQFEPSVKSD